MTTVRYIRSTLLAFTLAVLCGNAAANEAACLLIADLREGTIVHLEGQECDERIGPASTFKLTLSIMGYDAGILIDPETPAWPYDPSYEAVRQAERVTTTPRSWMADSVIWYSREVVRRLGAERFAAYTAALDYGNADVSGDPGANNGMTHSWLNRSLLISPREQADFVRRLVLGRLPVADASARKAMEATPEFDAGGGGWRLRGKTGTGYIREADGQLGRRQFGWFVGWASDGHRTLVFAHLIKDPSGGKSAAGPRARDALLGRWVALAGRRAN